ncbi:MAG: hypothetical protein WCG78_06940 [Candidatus Omnitrophota bacterium]
MFKRVIDKQIGQILRERGSITEAQLAEALAAQKENGGLLGEVLVTMGYAKEEEIAQALAIQYGFPYLPLDNYEIDSDIIKLLPLEIVKKYGVIPIDKMGSTLTVAMIDPLNLEATGAIEAATKCTVQQFVTTSRSLRSAIAKYYGGK